MAGVGMEKNGKSSENGTSPGVVAQHNPSPAGDGSTATPAVQPEGGAERQPTGWESFFAATKSLILRALVIYFITSFFRRPTPTPGNTDGTGPPRLPTFNIFDNATKLDVFFYISEQEEFNDFKNEGSLIWHLKNINYGDWYSGPNGDGTYSHPYTFVPSQRVRNNGSIYLHTYATRHGKTPDPNSPSFGRHEIVYTFKQLNRYKRQKYAKTHNLLTGETALTPEQQKIAGQSLGRVVSHWHPNITVNLVIDYTNWVEGSVPSPVDEYVKFLPDGKRYRPPLFINDYWNMKRDYQPINDTITSMDLVVTFQPLSLFRWQIYVSQNMRSKWTNVDIFGDNSAAEEEDDDSLKEALLETSPYLLGLTAFVSILHSVFELLAFKNDIQFWNNRKSLEGLSVRSVFFNVIQSVIVLLYVLDNDTNTMVRISCFVGLFIEIWKINKVVDVRIDRENPLFGSIPRISFSDKGSYTESHTKEYDALAFRYLSWAIYPLLAGYGVYSLLYQEHKGWYSWVLSMLYGFLLTFGFIMMTPQLFINYKLKSVAHLPWRMMTYKALNTFIDDIFAFVIKMPTMYRLGCFRDDIVFFIFLYQKFIYKTDLTRVNEFGFSAEMEEEAKKQVATTADSNGTNQITDKKND